MIDPLIMISIGVCFCVAELLLMNFVLIFFGFGFALVGLLNLGIKFSWEWQLLSSFMLSFILLFAFKKPLNKLFHYNSDKYKDNFLDESGVGEIKDGLIYYKGTFWKSDEISHLKDGDKVEVIGTSNGEIRVKK